MIYPDATLSAYFFLHMNSTW